MTFSHLTTSTSTTKTTSRNINNNNNNNNNSNSNHVNSHGEELYSAESDVLTAYRAKRARAMRASGGTPRRDPFRFSSVPSSTKTYFSSGGRNPHSRCESQTQKSEHLHLKADSVGHTERAERIRSRADGLLEYELPSHDFTGEIRSALQRVNERMGEHRNLLDRYSAIDTQVKHEVVPSIDFKYQQMADRMPELRNTYKRDRGERSVYDYPFTIRSDKAKNSRMRIERIMSRCRAL